MAVRHPVRANHLWHHERVNSLQPDSPIPAGAADGARLTAAQEAWVRHSESLWRKAHAIVAKEPTLDVGDVYHALRSLELTPAERLRRGLSRVRPRSHRR